MKKKDFLLLYKIKYKHVGIILFSIIVYYSNKHSYYNGMDGPLINFLISCLSFLCDLIIFIAIAKHISENWNETIL